jgi:hypothetical protein
MSTRESSLGAWADRIPRVDGWTSQRSWKDEILMPPPLSPAALAHEMRRAGLLLLIGIGTLLLAGGLVALNIDVILYGESTSGTVVDHRRGKRGHTPVATYQVGGQTYRVQGALYSDKSIYGVGDTVPVRFNPENPSRAVINDFKQLYLFPSIIGSLGAIFAVLAIGGAVYVQLRERRRRVVF